MNNNIEVYINSASLQKEREGATSQSIIGPQQVSSLSLMERVASGIQSWCLSQYLPVASSIWSLDIVTCRA